MKKTAVITGSSRGIGFSIAKQLGEDGYNIVITATSSEEINAGNMNALKKIGIAYAYVQGNIADNEARKKIIDTAVSQFGGVHVLVNNAGVAPLVRSDLLEMTEESFDRVIAINTKGNMFMSQLAAKYDNLIAQGLFPIPRWGTGEDVANAVSAFCSDKFVYSTGNYIDVDGGFHIKRL